MYIFKTISFPHGNVYIFYAQRNVHNILGVHRNQKMYNSTVLSTLCIYDYILNNKSITRRTELHSMCIENTLFTCEWKSISDRVIITWNYFEYKLFLVFDILTHNCTRTHLCFFMPMIKVWPDKKNYIHI